MSQLRISRTKKRKIAIFLRCLLISFAAWLLLTLSVAEDYAIRAGISYVNLPEEKAFHPLQSDTVSIRLKASGWRIFIHRLRQDMPNIRVDLSGLATRNYVVFANQLGYIDRQFPADRQVVGVDPDTLFFDFSKQSRRKVPIRPLYDLHFRKQYGLVGQIRANPEHATITGPLEDVANIAFLETDTIRGNDIAADVRMPVRLKSGQKTNISVYPTSSEVVIPVGEITEKVLDVPIKVENATKYRAVRTLPGKVRLTFLVPLKDYEKWTARDFEAVVDMQRQEETDARNLAVNLTKVPEFCHIVRIDPQNVDFMIITNAFGR